MATEGRPNVRSSSKGTARTFHCRSFGGHSGQPSRFYFSVLASWIKHHKFPLPGHDVSLANGVDLVVPQPVTADTRLRVTNLEQLPEDALLAQQGLRPIGFGREISGMDASGHPLPEDYSPFVLPLTITFKYGDTDLNGNDKRHLGIARFDPKTNRYTSDDLYVLRRDPEANSITFCASRFGKYVIVGKS